MSSNLGKNLTGLALLIALGTTGAYASDVNKLSELDINATESGYAVVLKTDSSAQMKKVVTSPDKMYIELKDVQAAEDLSTVYNNVANIENVTIQPVSDNNLKITLQGKDISSSKVYFEEAKTLPAAAADESQSIELSAPVTSYTPVYSAKNVIEVDQTANPKVNAMLTKLHIDRAAVVGAKDIINSLTSKAKDSNMLVAFGILLIAAALMFRPGKKPQRSLQIGLSHSLKDSQLQRETALAQRMTAPAAQDRMIGAPAASYGMKAYQQSLKNPYMTSNIAKPSGVSGIPRKPVAPRVRKPAPALKASAPQKIAAPVSAPVMQNTIKAQAPSVSTVAQNQSRAANIDSVKFLESITKIYEKNGRTDLAKGLKDNLKKVQTASY